MAPPLPELNQWLSAFECRFFDKQPTSILAETSLAFDEKRKAEEWAKNLQKTKTDHAAALAALPDNRDISFLKKETWVYYDNSYQAATQSQDLFSVSHNSLSSFNDFIMVPIESRIISQNYIT